MRRKHKTKKDGEVMKKRISLIIAFVLVIILLASCAPRQTQPQITPSPSPSPAQTTPAPIPTDEETGDDQNGAKTGEVTSPEGREDGVYTGKSDKDERGGYGEIKITIADGKITDVEYTEYTSDGKPKTKENGYEYEKAMEAFKELPKQLIETQNVNEIDDYSGATGTTEKFRTAAKRALSGTPAQDSNKNNETDQSGKNSDNEGKNDTPTESPQT